jgi:hypothetical protein
MPAINLKSHNLAFIHIPKTGGISIANWLITYFKNIEIIDRHPSIFELKEKFQFDKSFAVVRNPWDRAVSGYFSILQNKPKWLTNHQKFEKEFPSFSSWLERGLTLNVGSKWTLGTSQADWIDDSCKVLKFETLNDDFIQIQDQLNFHAPLLKLNTSVHGTYQHYYNSDQIKLIGKIFEKDIEKFKYTF